MRFLKLQVLFLFLAVVAVGAFGADVVLKNRAETELTAAVGARVPGTTGVRSKISSFPFVGRLLLSGHVPRVVVTAQHTTVGEVSLSDIRVQADDVEMDSDAAMDGRAVVRSIGTGSVRAHIRQDEINAQLPRGFSVQIQDGRATVTGPAAVKAQFVSTPQGSVRLQAGDRSLFDLPSPKTELLPCQPAATFVSGAVRLACTFDEVPPLLRDPATQ